MAKYRPALDGLRAVAVLGVVSGHAAPRLVPRGGLGVDLFFVLSGFLITRLLLEESAASGTLRLRAFYLRRLFRLSPALLAVVGAVALAAVLSGDNSGDFEPAKQLWVALALSTAYLADVAFGNGAGPAHVSGALFHTWSLGIEEHFYIVWPPILALCLRRRLRQTLVAQSLTLMVIVVCAWRLWLSLHGNKIAHIQFAFDTRADSCERS